MKKINIEIMKLENRLSSKNHIEKVLQNVLDNGVKDFFAFADKASALCILADIDCSGLIAAIKEESAGDCRGEYEEGEFVSFAKKAVTVLSEEEKEIAAEAIAMGKSIYAAAPLWKRVMR